MESKPDAPPPPSAELAMQCEAVGKKEEPQCQSTEAPSSLPRPVEDVGVTKKHCRCTLLSFESSSEVINGPSAPVQPSLLKRFLTTIAERLMEFICCRRR